MTLRIDKAGRIVVPKPLREQFGLTPETELEIVERWDGILLRKNRPLFAAVEEEPEREGRTRALIHPVTSRGSHRVSRGRR